MSEKRFTLDELYCYVIQDNKKRLTDKQVVNLLNEQQDTINELEKNFDDIVKWASEIAKRNVELDEQIGKLQIKLQEKEEEEKLYAQEILRLNTLLKQYQSNLDLGGDY